MTDLDQIMAVMDVAFDPHYREAWSRRQVEDSLELPTTFLLLADRSGEEPVEGSQAAGFILARQIIDEVELLLIGVAPHHRGKGVGRKLLDRFEEFSLGRGAHKLFLEMRANNPAENLYRSEGFRPIGRRRDYYRKLSGEHLDAITFEKRLKDS